MWYSPWTLWERARYLWTYIKALWRFWWFAHCVRRSDFVVYKVLAVNGDTGSTAVVPRSVDLDAWQDAVRSSTGWGTPNVRADVRYLAYGRKYRLVLRPGDAPVFQFKKHVGGPKGVLSATLCGRWVTGVDVTARVLKYQGPERDFHKSKGLKVGVLDLFPNDDPTELQHLFDRLELLDCRFVRHVIPINVTDLASAFAW